MIVQVRRTRISDRIRKLQELVPNMDKVSYLLLIDVFSFMTCHAELQNFLLCSIIGLSKHALSHLFMDG